MKDSKAPTVLFIGAGASAAIGFPTTKQVMERIGLEPFDAAKQEEVTEHTDLLRDIYSSLTVGKKDLEGILEFLRITNDEMSSYHLDILAQQFPSEHQASALDIVAKNKEATKQLEDDIKECMFNLYVYEAEKHRDKTESIYKPLIDLLLIDPIFETDVNELPIFTTNYDLVIERLVDRPFMRNFEFVDGFKAVGRFGEYVFSSDVYEEQHDKTVIKLFKLHGSLNWWNRKEDNRIVPWPDITSIRNPNFDSIPVVIYPAGYGPYPRDEFHILHDYLERYLKNTKRCIIIGYTFRDIGRASHIFDDVMRDTNLEVIISDIKSSIDELKEVKELFGKYEGRYEYYSEGIEGLPEKLKEKAKKPPRQKVDKTPKEPI